MPRCSFWLYKKGNKNHFSRMPKPLSLYKNPPRFYKLAAKEYSFLPGSSQQVTSNGLCPAGKRCGLYACMEHIHCPIQASSFLCRCAGGRPFSDTGLLPLYNCFLQSRYIAVSFAFNRIHCLFAAAGQILLYGFTVSFTVSLKTYCTADDCASVSVASPFAPLPLMLTVRDTSTLSSAEADSVHSVIKP